MRKNVKSSQIFNIPSVLLSYVSGGHNDNSTPSPSPVTVIGGGGPNGASGAVITTLPVGPNTTITTYIQIDTTNGLNGAGAVLNINWG